jgi:hypothetical protein
MDPGILAALTTASGVEIADLARAALAPLLRHDALVLVTSASAGLLVRIAAPRGLRESLVAVDWRRAVEHGTAADGTATGLQRWAARRDGRRSAEALQTEARLLAAGFAEVSC